MTKVLKEKMVSLEFFTQQKHFSKTQAKQKHFETDKSWKNQSSAVHYKKY